VWVGWLLQGGCGVMCRHDGQCGFLFYPFRVMRGWESKCLVGILHLSIAGGSWGVSGGVPG
jgi:hypothetical protein